MIGVGDLVRRIGDGQAQVGYSVAEQSGGRMMSCAACTVHVEMRSAGFLVVPQNQGRWFISGLTSIPLGRFVSGLTSIPMVTVSPNLASKPVASDFLVWTTKPAAIVW
jgi:hypothetical protein